MANSNNQLKAYVRYDGTGRVIPGSLILQRFKPKVGNWQEIDAQECCNYTTTTTTTTVTPTTTTTSSSTSTSTTSTSTTSVPSTYEVTNEGTGAYLINGSANPTLTVVEGQTYTFNINAVGHPFWIKTVSSLGTNNAYNTGVTNNGTDNGVISFTVPFDAPSTLYYNCQYHSSMAGTINVVDVSTTTTTTTAL